MRISSRDGKHLGFFKKAGSVLHKGLDVFLKDLGVFLKAERVLKKDLGLFFGGRLLYEVSSA